MSCNCIDKVNNGLASYNTRLTIPIVFGGGPQMLLVQTEQIETGRGKKKACAMFASFCPFCGTKVEGGGS